MKLCLVLRLNYFFKHNHWKEVSIPHCFKIKGGYPTVVHNRLGPKLEKKLNSLAKFSFKVICIPRLEGRGGVGITGYFNIQEFQLFFFVENLCLSHILKKFRRPKVS